MQGVPEGFDVSRDNSSASRDLVAEINSFTDLTTTCLSRPALPCSVFYGGTDPADVQVWEQDEKGECILELRLSRKNDFGALWCCAPMTKHKGCDAIYSKVLSAMAGRKRWQTIQQ